MNDKVRKAYDLIAPAYAQQRNLFKNDRHLQAFADLLPAAARVLDLGCGAGVPVARVLLERGFSVTGIDISSAQIELAQANCPNASFAVRDMLDLKPADYRVDAIVSFYTIFHVPRETHGGLLTTLRSFLNPDGLLLVSMGATSWEGSEPFHGVEMSWSHYDAATNRRLIEAAGFDILSDEIDTSGGEEHQVVMARAR